MLKLNQISDNIGARKKRMRVGRGPGSGWCKTAGRGQKGQKSRSGVSRLRLIKFEGGQNPLYLRLPKRGFTPHNKQKFNIITTADLNAIASKGYAGEVMDAAYLYDKKVIKDLGLPVKLLFKEEVSSSIKVKLDKVSAQAKASIDSKGGEVVIENA